MATIASLVVQIGADIADLKRGVDEATSKVDSFAGKATKALNALTSAAAFGLVAAGFREIGAAADEIDTLSGRIDDSVGAVQRLQAASESYDTELGAMIAGVQTLTDKLGSGKLGPSLEKLNIDLRDFQALGPAARFLEVSEALAKIENPAQRAALATEIFGKNAKSLAGAFREGVSDVDRWIAMSEGAVSASDRLSTFFTKARASLVNFSAEVVYSMSLLRQWDTMRDLFSKATPPALPNSPLQAPGGFAPGMPSKEMLDDIAASTKALIKDTSDFAAEHKKAEEAIKREQTAFRESVSFMATAAGNWRMWSQYAKGAFDSATLEAFEFEQQFRRILTAIDLSANAWEPLKAGIEDSGEELDKLHARVQQLASWRGVGQSIAGAIMAAIQGGGDVGRSIGGQVGQQLGTQLGNSIGNWAGRAIGGGLGAAIGGAAGSILPGVGTLLGSMAGSAIGNLFGGGQGRQVNDMRDQFVAAAGGIHELNVRAQEAGLTLDRLLRARNVQDFQAAVNELNGAFNEQQQLQQRGIAAMERYGITIEQAGQKFKQTQTNMAAEDLVKDFQALLGVGVDLDVIIEKMGGSVGTFVHQALDMGTSVPREMEPMIRRMIEMGTLTDKNGEKFTDIAQIPFAETINESIGKLMDKISLLIDQIGAGLGGALNRLPRNIDIDINGHVNIPGIDSQIPALAEGGLVRRPTLALVGEAGPEAVVPLTRMGQLQAANRGGGETHIHLHNPILSGYSSAVSAAREILNVLTSESERRGRSAAFGAA